MSQLLAIICFAPLLSSLLLMAGSRSFSKMIVNALGVGSIFLCALLTIIIGISFLQQTGTDHAMTLSLGEWFGEYDLHISFNFYLDALSLVWLFVITFVGAFIHLFATGYMVHEKDYARFFACM